LFSYIIDIIVTGWLVFVPAVVLLTIFLKNRLFRRTIGVALVSLTLLILFQPKLSIPVKGASANDWNPKTFWYEPWGKSVVHRGIDIFAKSGTDIISPTTLLVFYTGINPVSGKFVLGIDRSMRVHFFAHMKSISSHKFNILFTDDKIGSVGDTGNAAGKPPHLHYGIASFVPQFWKMSSGTLGHLRAFYINPIDHF
jgi:murein DD-endopeptidase MepM/ murein hydrolase activator NlpD